MVAAVNGPAVGIGCSLALACDLIWAGESAVFGLAFVNIGLVPDGGSTFLVPVAVGKARALEMALLGEPVSAEQALDWGLINRVVPDGKLMDEARGLARRLAAGPTRSYAKSKRALNNSLMRIMEEQLDLEADIQREMARTRRLHRGRLRPSWRSESRISRAACERPICRHRARASRGAGSPVLHGR